MDSQGVELTKLEPKAEYAPLFVAIGNESLIKKKKDIASLSLGPPIGLRPKTVSNEIATEFVKQFVRGVRAQTLRFKKKK